MTAAEVAEVLRELIDAKRPIRLVDPRRPWVQVAVGEVAFQSGDLTLVMYADSASLDHVVSVERASGERTGQHAIALLPRHQSEWSHPFRR